MDMKTVTYKDKVTGRTDSYEIPASAETADEIRSALKPLVLANRELFKKPKMPPRSKVETMQLMTPPGVFPMAGLLGTPERQAQQDVQTLIANQLLGFGVPSKVLSEVGFEGPQDLVEQTRERLGGLTIPAEAVGQVAIGGPAYRGIQQTLSKLGMRPGIPRSMVGGGIEGAPTGYGATGREEGIGGTAVGTFVGTALPGILGLLGKAATTVVAPATEAALSKIKNVLDIEGKTAKDIIDLSEEATPTTIAEQIGESGELLVKEATTKTGSARRKAQETLGERSLKFEERIFAGAEKFMPPQIEDTIRALIKDGKSAASSVYEKAKLFNPTGKARDDFFQTKNPGTGSNLNNYLNRPMFKDAFKAAKTKSENEFGVEIKGGIKDSNNIFSILDLMKREIDQKIGVFLRDGEMDDYRMFTKVKNEFLETIDAANPDYKKARSLWAGEEALENSVNLGEQIFNKKTSIKDIKNFLNKASDAEKAHFGLGVSKSILGDLQKINPTKLIQMSKKTANDLFQPDEMKKLRLAFDDDEAFNIFMKKVSDEIKMKVSSEKMIPGTGAIEDTGFVENIVNSLASPAVVGRLFGRNIAGGAAVGGGTLIRRALTKEMSPEEAGVVVDILLKNTPEGRKSVAESLLRTDRISEELYKKVDNIISTMVGAAAPVSATVAEQIDGD